MTITFKQVAFKRAMTGTAALALLAAGTAGRAQQQPAGQDAPDGAGNSADNLDLPANVQIFGKLDPNVRKPTAIVNDFAITGTDVDQRVQLIAIANNATLTAPERDRLRRQVLRALIDETLEIQEAKSEDITVTPDKIDDAYGRVAGNFRQPADKLATYLRANGSSERALKRQIEGELAWSSYLHRKIDVNVSDAEVAATIDRLKAAQGTDEYEVREIYLAVPNPGQQQQRFAQARDIMAQMEQGKLTFDAAARQFSDSTSKVNGGDLGWIKLSTLPDGMAAAAQQMQVGQLAGPVDAPGGYSIIYLADKRQVGAADPRDARLSLKQLTVRFPAGLNDRDANTRAAAFGKQLQALQGCGTVDKVARTINAEVVDNAAVRVRDLPPQLQEIMLKLQVGQATPPFGSPEQGVRALVLCGRDDAKAAVLPTAQQVQSQLEDSRVNLRAQQKLRDLRRDAVVEYR